MRSYRQWCETNIPVAQVSDHPFKFSEAYKDLIVRVLSAALQQHQAVVQEAMGRVQAAKQANNPEQLNQAVRHANMMGGVAKGYQDMIAAAKSLSPETDDLEEIRKGMLAALQAASKKYSSSYYHQILKFLEKVPANIAAAHAQEYKAMTPGQRQKRANAQKMFRMQNQQRMAG